MRRGMEPAGNVCDLVRKPYSMKNCEITVYGLVQGIGYRPFVAEMAEKLGMKPAALSSKLYRIKKRLREDPGLRELWESL